MMTGQHRGQAGTAGGAYPMSKRATYLTVSQVFTLENQCRLLVEAYGWSVYHVGSSLERQDFRDVDLRCMLDDDEFDRMFGTNKTRLWLLNSALSDWLAARTGLNIDFQFQRTTEANRDFGGYRRNAVGHLLDGVSK